MIYYFIIAALFFSFSSGAAEIQVPQGIYKPVFKEPGESDQIIGPLYVDETPVTNGEFLKFVEKNSEFRKSKMKPIFANSGYLSHWSGDLKFKKEIRDFPVTHVSWFAARRYCQAKGMRLPTIAEWEFISDANHPKNEEAILKWYSNPKSSLKNVGLDKGNKFGLKDIHGHIWEWTDNFSEVIMSGDSRGESAMDQMFCGGAALKSKDPSKYASFLRFAHRSSLDAKYTSKNLGFRCVRDGKEK